MQKQCVKEYTWSGTFRCVTVTKCQEEAMKTFAYNAQHLVW